MKFVVIFFIRSVQLVRFFKFYEILVLEFLVMIAFGFSMSFLKTSVVTPKVWSAVSRHCKYFMLYYTLVFVDL